MTRLKTITLLAVSQHYSLRDSSLYPPRQKSTLKTNNETNNDSDFGWHNDNTHAQNGLKRLDDHLEMGWARNNGARNYLLVTIAIETIIFQI
ncbi:MAG: hypothetical protein ABIH24_01925 [Verrucomicrobiota bacterium]